jgi:DNA-binding transcriptional LysR family regulator
MERQFEAAFSRVIGPVPDEFAVETLFEDRLVIATGVSNPLARRRRLELADLICEPWALFPFDSPFGSLIENVFRSRGLAVPQPTVTSVSPYLLNALRETGHFVSMVPRFSLELPRKHRSIVTLPILLPETQMAVGVLTLKNRMLTPIAKAFLAQVQIVAKPLARPK